MSTSVTSVTKHFPSPQNGFTTTLSSSISSGATTVPLNSVSGYNNGDVAVFVVDPENSKKQTFTGTVDTSGLQVTGVVWTAGANVAHTLGATVVDYFTATHVAMISKGVQAHANQDGTLKTAAVQAALSIGSSAADGWTVSPYTASSVTANGNRSYNITVNTQDLTSFLSPGMRLKTVRTTAAPTKSTSLNGTTQYYSKTSPAGMTFTDDFAVGAWIKLSAYPSVQASVISRFNATSGWSLRIVSTGQVELVGFNAGGGNFSFVLSNQSIPLNKWVHIAAQLDMSAFTATTTTSYVMIDGVDVPATVTRGGTNPTALVQAGNLEVGSENAGSFLTGKIAQVAIYNAKVTQATILAGMNQALAGTETSLISVYSFNNSINDLNANANNLTANNGAVATTADSPFAQAATAGTDDFGIIQSVSYSTNTTITVQAAEGSTFPTSGAVTSLYYSNVRSPYKFPSQQNKWRLQMVDYNFASTASTNAWTNLYNIQLVVPAGEWRVGYSGLLWHSGNTNVTDNATLSTTNNSQTNDLLGSGAYLGSTTGGSLDIFTPMRAETGITNTVATTYYLNINGQSAVGNCNWRSNAGVTTTVWADNAYL